MVTQVPDETKPCSASWTWKSTKGVRAMIHTAWDVQNYSSSSIWKAALVKVGDGLKVVTHHTFLKFWYWSQKQHLFLWGEKSKAPNYTTNLEKKNWFLPDCERMCLMKNCLAYGKKSTCFAHPVFWLSEPYRKIWMPASATEKGLYLSSGGILPQTTTLFLGEVVPYFFFRQSIVTSPLMMCPATIQNFVYWYWRYCSMCTWKLEPIKNLGENL